MQRIKLEAVDRLSFLSELVAGKSILHVGCCGIVYKLEIPAERENHLHYRLYQSASFCAGVDLDQEELKYMESHGISNLYLGDAAKLEQAGIGKKFDYLLLGNMFNYIADTRKLLDSSANMLHDDGYLVITIENDYAFKKMLRYILFAKDSCFYHHLFSLGPTTLPKLLREHGYHVESLKSFWFGPDIFLKQRTLSRFSNQLIRLLPRSSNFADGLIAICKKSLITNVAG